MPTASLWWLTAACCVLLASSGSVLVSRGGRAATGGATQATAPASSDCGVPLLDTAFATSSGIAYALTANASSCCDACGATSACSAYTWRPPSPPSPLGRCFLKSSGDAPSAAPGAVSGRLAGSTPSACPFGTVPCAAGGPAAGACALFASWCATAPASCAAGSSICPDGVTCVPGAAGWAGCPALPAYLNASVDARARAAALVASLSLDELAPQLSNQGYGSGPPGPPGIPRLAVPPYNWLNEGLHGVARAGLATSFPQISVVGATWNVSVFAAMGRILGAEARAKYAMARRANGTTQDYTGVTFYAPNTNLGRDARWGRIQEVPSECPFVTSAYAFAVITAAQSPVADGSGERTPAIAGCCKHLVAYSFEDWDGIQRAAQNAIVSGRDLLESYLPAFQTGIRDARCSSIMGSYNAVNGVPTCASNFLLNTTVRGRYNFSGWIMSDYSAIRDTYSSHAYCGAGPDAADICTATALRAGVDQDGGGTEFSTAAARLIAEGYLTPADVSTAAARLFAARLELGILSPPEAAPYSSLSAEEWLDTDAFRAASYEAAQQGIVLLKNDNNLLPLSPPALAGKKIAIIGPNADVPDVLYGNYEGTPPYLITPFAGLAAALPGAAAVATAPGCASVACPNSSGFPAALALAAAADVVVGVFGLDQTREAEGLDRTSLDLPGQQLPLLLALAAAAAARGAPFILVLVTGGPVDLSAVAAAASVPAIVLLGYASQSAGTALADVLLGAFPPAGKLAVSWHANASTDLPPFPDMALPPNAATGTPGRTYRYSTVAPVYAFGHGLTYTSWSVTAAAAVPPPAAAPCTGGSLSATLTNTGTRASGEVIELYLIWGDAERHSADFPAPQIDLVGFQRVGPLAPGDALPLSFTLPPRAYARVNATAAASFGQHFNETAAGGDAGTEALASGAAFGLDRDWRQGATGAIGWDDLLVIAPGAARLWVGSGQPGTGAPGAFVDFSISSAITNLAQCAQQGA